jgi:hypothetical protein
MANQAARGFIPGAANVTIPAGYYSGSGVVTGDVDLVTANIRAGANVFGVTGTPAVVNTASGTAVAGDILAGDTAYVNGAQITGTMTNQAARGFMPGPANVSIPAGYYNGSGVVTGDSDLAATNIAQGVTIFGVTGTVSMARLPKTGWTNSYQTGDDGYYKKGAPDPSPRFTIQANTNCVLDNRTGLIWARTYVTNNVTWSNAIVYCEALNYGGQTDWRLPNRFELESLLDLGQFGTLPSGHPFNLVHTGWNWSSSTYLTYMSTAAWAVSLFDAQVGLLSKTTPASLAIMYVWPVRGGQ